MGRVISDMSMSLDGFIVGSEEDRLHDWVFKGPVEVTIAGITFHMASEASAEILKTLIQNAGSVIVGKQGFKSVNETAIFQLPTFVLAHDAQTSITGEGATITFVTDGIHSALAQAQAAAGDKDVYIFGGANTIQQYLIAGLIDEIRVDLVPILMGHGIRLFDHLANTTITLEIADVIPSQGVTHLKYRIVKSH